MSPNGGGAPTGDLAAAIDAAFVLGWLQGGLRKGRWRQFGSGWAWLVSSSGALSIVATGNAETPATDSSVTPLLTCDVWEHAYYVDYRNARGSYVEAWWNLVNWDFAASNYANR